MDWELFSWAIVALMVIVAIVFLYSAVKAFKVKNKFLGVISLALAAVMLIGTYAIYGEMIIGLFKK